MRYINIMPELGHTHVVLLATRSTDPVLWAFNIPTGDLEYLPEYDMTVPVQLLPLDYDVSMYRQFDGDDDPDYLIWAPYFKAWEYYALGSEYWSFAAGYYVYCLDDNGNPIQDLVDMAPDT